MTVLPMLAAGVLMGLVAILFVLVSIVLILVILVQKGRGGGLSGAFGGGMAGGLLGSKTGDFLTWVTIVLVAVFLLLAVLMARFFKPSVGEYGADAPAPTAQTVGSEQTPVVTPEVQGQAPAADEPVAEPNAPAAEAAAVEPNAGSADANLPAQ